MNLKKLLLDDKHLVPRPVTVTGQRGGVIYPSPANPRHSMLLAGSVIFSIIALALSILFNGASEGGESQIIVDPVTLCPVDKLYIVRETYIHIDLSEALSEDQRGWLKELLTVSQNNNLPPRSLFSISQMQTKPNAPRVEVQQFCIPNISDIGVAGNRITRRDCPEITEEEFDWKQNRTRHVGTDLQEKIKGACNNYVRLKKKVQEAADRYKKVILGQNRSYIVGSIEDALYATVRPGSSRIPTQLIVFSDMLQNAKWFSQYNTRPEEWTAKNFKKLRKGEAAVKELGNKPPPADLKFNRVLLCVLPSAHSILANARSQSAHKEMWRGYFKNRVVRPSPDNLRIIPASACAVAAGEWMK